MSKKIFVTFFLAISTVFTLHARAQSVAVLGGNGDAERCFDASRIAAITQDAVFGDIETCSRALDLGNLSNRDRVATLINRGIIYVALQRPQKAVKDYEQALSINDDFGEIYVNRGNLWFSAGHFEEAIADYDLAMTKPMRRKHVAFFNRGMAYENLGKREQAEQDFVAALELRPEWRQASERLARLLGDEATDTPADGVNENTLQQ